MKKILSIALLGMTLMFSFGFTDVAFAQVSSFPAGCSSTVGYSTTTGLACSGTGVANTSFMPGCSSIFGYSTSTGLACNGGFSANTSFFPGCTSIYGFSTTSGVPCSGGISATTAFLPGCSSALGTSTTTGLPCSGGTTPLAFLAGCNTVFGYSTVNGQPCNGTQTASLDTTGGAVLGESTPGLPTTGFGGSAAANILLVGVSGLLSIWGVSYLVRREGFKI